MSAYHITFLRRRCNKRSSRPVTFIMAVPNEIAVFPLNILPIPGELVRLHIFEPRYRQLLSDIEASGDTFGIFFANTANKRRLGSLVRLEKVTHQYPSGESDILVKCEGLFHLVNFQKKWNDRLYPGGEIDPVGYFRDFCPNKRLLDTYEKYQNLRKGKKSSGDCSMYDIANSLELDISDKLKLVSFHSTTKQEQFLASRLQFRVFLIEREQASKRIFHLN